VSLPPIDLRQGRMSQSRPQPSRQPLDDEMADLATRMPPAQAAALAVAAKAKARALAAAAEDAAFRADFPSAEPVDAVALIDERAAWLPPAGERRTAFLQVFRYWHSQVRPGYTASATPAFLFLVTVLPVMAKARDELKEMSLWEPPEGPMCDMRDVQPAWRKYCEFLPRVQQAAMEIAPYRALSLVADMDGLLARVTAAEKGFREG
jgi:hypothetical protein